MYVCLLYEILREKSLVLENILSNIKLILTNVKCYQRYAKVVRICEMLTLLIYYNILPQKE